MKRVGGIRLENEIPVGLLQDDNSGDTLIIDNDQVLRVENVRVHDGRCRI